MSDDLIVTAGRFTVAILPTDLTPRYLVLDMSQRTAAVVAAESRSLDTAWCIAKHLSDLGASGDLPADYDHQPDPTKDLF